MRNSRVVILGRFPPPLDGQSVITARLFDLLGRAYEVDRVDMTPVSTGNPLQKLERLSSLRRRLEKAGAYDQNTVVIWCSISPNPPGHFRDFLSIYPALKATNAIAVVHHGNFDSLFQNVVTRTTGHRLVSSLKKLVLLENRLAENVANWIGEEKCTVIPNPPDFDHPQGQSNVETRIAQGPGHPLKLLFLSNIMKSKGYPDVLRAGALLKEKGRDIQIQFVGRWVEGRDDFDRLVQQLDLAGNVAATGVVTDRTQIRDIHLEADVFILPTSYPTEAQPVSIIEALESGTPIITCRQGGIPDMVSDGLEAIFVNPGEPSAIAEAVQRLSDRTIWQQFATNCRSRFSERFDADTISKKWAALINSASS